MTTLGKLPPQAVELEEPILGAMMLEKGAVGLIIDRISPEMFYKDVNKSIAQAIYDLYRSGAPVDMKTVVHQLRKTGQLEHVGGAHIVAELTAKVNSSANIEAHAMIIKEQAIKREVIRVASEAVKDSYEDTIDVWKQVDKLEGLVIDLSDMAVAKDYQSVAALVPQAIQEVEDGKNSDQEETGVPSGIKALDKVTAGWQPTDVIVIAARPGMGKTAFALQCALNAAIDFQEPVAFFSLEMGAIQLTNRLISQHSGIPYEDIRRKRVSEHQWPQYIEKAGEVADAPIFIDDSPGITILELRAKARRMQMKHGIKLIIIDYLQLMSGHDSFKKHNREQEISEISRNIKIIAKELNVPVIELSQLSRAVETRGGNKRPQLSDLRESGAIEQDADVVMFLFRPEYYGLDTGEDGMPLNNYAEIIISKHRNGRLDDVSAKFIGPTLNWKDWDTGTQFPQIAPNTEFTITLPGKRDQDFPKRDVTGDTKDEDQPF